MDRPRDPRAPAHPPPQAGARGPSKRVLEPMERISEILFGLVMSLTFTGAISAAEGGREEVRTLLFGAVGCNVAWGIVDAAMYLMGCLAERGLAWRAARAFRAARGPEEAHRAVERTLPAGIAAALGPEDLEALRRALERSLADPPRPSLRREDARGALGVFLLVSSTTFPVVVPFLFLREATTALRISNAVAVAMLFVAGHAFGKVAGLRPWAAGVATVVVGLVLVAVTMALGG